MDVKDIRKLILSDKKSVAIYGLDQWHKECSHLPDLLIDALKTSNLEVLNIALRHAKHYHPKDCAPFFVKLMSSANDKIRCKAVQFVSLEMGDEVAKCVEGLLQNEKDVHVLATAVSAAKTLNINTKYIESYLKHNDTRLRANTVRSLSALAKGRLQELLEPMLKDKALRVQNEAIKGLAQMIPEHDLEKLIEKRLSSTDIAVRSSTAYITGELPLARKIPFLMDALNDKVSSVVVCAIRALCSVQSPVGFRGMINLYFSTNDVKVVKAVLFHAANIPIEIILSAAEEFKISDDQYQAVLIRVLMLAENIDNWERFLPWIILNIQNPDVENRLLALRFVFNNLPYFMSDINSLVKKAEFYSTPDDLAMTAIIRWKSGQTGYFEKLEKMAHLGSIKDMLAVAKVLTLDNSLISRQLLADIKKTGILDTEKQSNHQPTKQIKLPEM